MYQVFPLLMSPGGTFRAMTSPLSLLDQADHSELYMTQTTRLGQAGRIRFLVYQLEFP